MDYKDFFKNVGQDMDLEFMPIAPFGESKIDEEEIKTYPDILPIVPLKNTVLFPSVVLPINASRDQSVEAFNFAQKNNSFVGIVTQKVINNTDNEVGGDDLYEIGTIAKIIKQINIPDGNKAHFIMGRIRFRILEIIQSEPFIQARVEYIQDLEYDESTDTEFKAQLEYIKDMVDNILNLSTNMPPEIALILRNIESKKFLINYISSNLPCPIHDKQLLLEKGDLKERAKELITLLQKELQIVEIKNEINVKTKGEIDKQQREFFLQQQLKSIKDELNGGNESSEIADLKQRAENKIWPEYAKTTFEKGLEKLERMHPQAPEYSIQMNYLSLLIDLPWGKISKDDFDIKKAKKMLDADHSGLEKVKDRILEYLSVLKLKGDMKSPILCFVGPPGIGKTSLGQSIAKSINREFARISLGGMHDESELRGHRKTYIGAMPGRIIQTIKKSKVSNPVIVLDEIEKMGKDFRGDPSSALLEILDPEQNSTFYDNYLELEYDLSKVMFIATANSIAEIQPALRDRMEIISLSGYSVEEKLEIARKHLLKKQQEAHGLSHRKLTVPKVVLLYIINHYTRESGLRELERRIAAIMRYVAKAEAMEGELIDKISIEDVKKCFGKEIYDYDKDEEALPSGVAIGLAWTSVGGDILYIESSLSKGKGNLIITGNLGEVMKESARTALSYIRAHSEEWGIDIDEMDKKDIHIHVPEGAIPKDGPSAGITLLSSLVSAFSGRPLKNHFAMTGEITLRGDVLPVGGIKEKILAAKRSGIKNIVLCHQNRKDIEEINPIYIKGLKIHYVKKMNEVLKIVLQNKKKN